MSYAKLLSAKVMREWKVFGGCREILDSFASRKQKYIRGNNTPFMNNNLSKEVIKRWKLRKKFLKVEVMNNKSGSDEERKRYSKQQSLCAIEKKKNYYSNLNKKMLQSIKNFGKL